MKHEQSQKCQISHFMASMKRKNDKNNQEQMNLQWANIKN